MGKKRKQREAEADTQHAQQEEPYKQKQIKNAGVIAGDDGKQSDGLGLAAAGELQAEPAAKRAKPAPAIPDASNHGLHIGAKEQKEHKRAIPGGLTWRDDFQRKDVKHGKFSDDEIKSIRKAVHEYAVEHGLSTTNFEWLHNLTALKHKGAISKIAVKACPHRVRKAVLQQVQRLFWPYKTKEGRWSKEEDKRLADLFASYGKKYTKIAIELGRHPASVRDRYRDTIAVDIKGRGEWKPEEVQALKQAVAEYQAMRQELKQGRAEEGSTAPLSAPRDRRLDLIDWEWVAKKVGRPTSRCRLKWYGSVSPSMVERGDWERGDDRRMLTALRDGDWEREWEVPWGKLVAGRTEEAIKRRWTLMTKAVKGAHNMEFPEIVDYLVERYLSNTSPSKGDQQGGTTDLKADAMDTDGEGKGPGAATKASKKDSQKGREKSGGQNGRAVLNHGTDVTFGQAATAGWEERDERMRAMLEAEMEMMEEAERAEAMGGESGSESESSSSDDDDDDDSSSDEGEGQQQGKQRVQVGKGIAGKKPAAAAAVAPATKGPAKVSSKAVVSSSSSSDDDSNSDEGERQQGKQGVQVGKGGPGKKPGAPAVAADAVAPATKVLAKVFSKSAAGSRSSSSDDDSGSSSSSKSSSESSESSSSSSEDSSDDGEGLQKAPAARKPLPNGMAAVPAPTKTNGAGPKHNKPTAPAPPSLLTAAAAKAAAGKAPPGGKPAPSKPADSSSSDDSNDSSSSEESRESGAKSDSSDESSSSGESSSSSGDSSSSSGSDSESDEPSRGGARAGPFATPAAAAALKTEPSKQGPPAGKGAAAPGVQGGSKGRAAPAAQAGQSQQQAAQPAAGRLEPLRPAKQTGVPSGKQAAQQAPRKQPAAGRSSDSGTTSSDSSSDESSEASDSDSESRPVSSTAATQKAATQKLGVPAAPSRAKSDGSSDETSSSSSGDSSSEDDSE